MIYFWLNYVVLQPSCPHQRRHNPMTGTSQGKTLTQPIHVAQLNTQKKKDAVIKLLNHHVQDFNIIILQEPAWGFISNVEWREVQGPIALQGWNPVILTTNNNNSQATHTNLLPYKTWLLYHAQVRHPRGLGHTGTRNITARLASNYTHQSVQQSKATTTKHTQPPPPCQSTQGSPSDHHQWLQPSPWPLGVQAHWKRWGQKIRINCGLANRGGIHHVEPKRWNHTPTVQCAWKGISYRSDVCKWPSSTQGHSLWVGHRPRVGSWCWPLQNQIHNRPCPGWYQ